MLKFPVDVKKTKEDQYEARLADMPNGPCGLGGDPYSAFEDLIKGAETVLFSCVINNLLPKPSEINDRPIISINPEDALNSEIDLKGIIDTNQKNSFTQMINYSWTNHDYI